MQQFQKILTALALSMLSTPVLAQNEQASRELAQQLKGVFLSADQTISTVSVTNGIEYHDHTVAIDDVIIRFTTWSTGRNEHCQLTRNFEDSASAISYIDYGCSGSIEQVMDRLDDLWLPARPSNDTENAAYQLLLRSYNQGLRLAIRIISDDIRAADIDFWTRLTPEFRTFNNSQNMRLILNQPHVDDDFLFFAQTRRVGSDVYLEYLLDESQEYMTIRTRFVGNYEANGYWLIEYRIDTTTGVFEQSRRGQVIETGEILGFTPWLDITETQQSAAALALRIVAVASGIPTSLQISE